MKSHTAFWLWFRRRTRLAALWSSSDATGHATFYETALNTGPAELCTRPAGVCSTSLPLSLSLPCQLLHLKTLAYFLSSSQRQTEIDQAKAGEGSPIAIVEWSSACLLTAVARSQSETNPAACSMAYAGRLVLLGNEILCSPARLVLLVTVVSALAGRSGTHAPELVRCMTFHFLVSLATSL
jgi:hypothetical protein